MGAFDSPARSYCPLPKTLGITTIISIVWVGNLFAHGIVFATLGQIVGELVNLPKSINLMDVISGYGLKEWDVIGFFLFLLPSVLIPILFYFLFSGLGEKVSEFVRQYLELGSFVTGLK